VRKAFTLFTEKNKNKKLNGNFHLEFFDVAEKTALK
jgi:hypothetical protein